MLYIKHIREGPEVEGLKVEALQRKENPKTLNDVTMMIIFQGIQDII